MFTIKEYKDLVEVPAKVMMMNLNPYELAIYSFLLYLTRKHKSQKSCHPSMKTIGDTFGINKNTVLKYVRSLEDKLLIETYPTKIFTKSGKTQNGNLRYVILSVENAFKNYQERKQQENLKKLAKLNYESQTKNA